MKHPTSKLRLGAAPAAARPQSAENARNVGTYQLDGDRRGQTTDLVEWVDLDGILPSRTQRRVLFDVDELRRLGESFGRNFEGLVHPPTVRRLPDGRIELIGGEQRVRAARLLGHTRMPVLVREMTDAESRVAGAAENLLRPGLTAWETAMMYSDLRADLRETGRKNAGARSIEKLGVPHRESQIGNYLRISNRIDLRAILDAGAGAESDPERPDADVLRALDLHDLLAAAREPERAARVAVLERRIAAIRADLGDGRGQAAAPSTAQTHQSLGSSDGSGTPLLAKAAARQHGKRAVSPRGHSHDAPLPGVLDLVERGGFRKNLGSPFKKLDDGGLRYHTRVLATALAALGTVHPDRGRHFAVRTTVLKREPVVGEPPEYGGEVVYVPSTESLRDQDAVQEAVLEMGELFRGLAARARELGAAPEDLRVLARMAGNAFGDSAPPVSSTSDARAQEPSESAE